MCALTKDYPKIVLKFWIRVLMFIHRTTIFVFRRVLLLFRFRKAIFYFNIRNYPSKYVGDDRSFWIRDLYTFSVSPMSYWRATWNHCLAIDSVWLLNRVLHFSRHPLRDTYQEDSVLWFDENPFQKCRPLCLFYSIFFFFGIFPGNNFCLSSKRNIYIYVRNRFVYTRIHPRQICSGD